MNSEPYADLSTKQPMNSYQSLQNLHSTGHTNSSSAGRLLLPTIDPLIKQQRSSNATIASQRARQLVGYGNVEGQYGRLTPNYS